MNQQASTPSLGQIQSPNARNNETARRRFQTCTVRLNAATVTDQDQTEKLDPQPQVVVAFGFFMTN